MYDSLLGLLSNYVGKKLPGLAVFVIPRKKVLVLRDALCIGIALSEIQNGTKKKRNSVKNVFKVN
jgi:hypothetical protein